MYVRGDIRTASKEGNGNEGSDDRASEHGFRVQQKQKKECSCSGGRKDEASGCCGRRGLGSLRSW